MQAGEEVEITIEQFFEECEEGGIYQIDTPDGWKDIDFLVKKNNKNSYNLVCEDGTNLGCSSDHYVLTQDGWKKSEDLNVEHDKVVSRDGLKTLVAKEFLGTRDTFDMGVASEEHRYYSNDIVSHNTGKSLTCSALAAVYEMPLLRLDMGAIFGAHIGESEANIRNAIQTVEAIAPAILWIDEVEKGISGIGSSNMTDGGVSARVFGTLITWMQEKKEPVFVVATANNIAGIPPEFLRAGRFDEIFFLDLPNDEQRREVVEKLITKKGRDASVFDIDKLVERTRNYSPAEIEKGVDNALFLAFSENKRDMVTDDILIELGKFQPLYNGRREDIENMRTQALGEQGSGGVARLANSSKNNHPAYTQSVARNFDLKNGDL